MKNIKLDYRKITIILVIILIMLTTITTCIENKLSGLQWEYKVLKENYETQKNIVSTVSSARQKEKDSLNFVISQREVENNFLRDENNKYKGDIQKIKNRPVKTPKGLENLTQYFNDRYKTKENIVVSNKVGLAEESAMDAVSELEEFDKVVEIVPLQESVIKNQEKSITNLEKDKVDLKTQVSSAENLIEEQERLNKMAEDNINNLEQQIKKQKSKNFWNKVLIIGGSVGGFLLGSQL